MLNKEGFDLWANGYDRSVGLSEENNKYPFAGYKEVLNTIYKRIRQNHAEKVLDIGFGTGTLTKKLYDSNIDITGIDFSTAMIEIAQQKMPNAKLLQFDFSKGLPAPLENEKFDFIVCTYAIHHLTDPQKATFLQSLKKHLNPAGEILIGDVAFQTRAELEKCRAACKEEWDDDEIYIVADELSQALESLEFIKISHCAGVCIFT